MKPTNMLKRPLTTTELIQLNKMFSFGRGYKDLIRDFKKDFHIDLPKPLAKEFMFKRSWSDVLTYLTGEKIVPPDADDTIPQLESKRFELLEHMLAINKADDIEREKELAAFEQSNYFIPSDVKYFNLPLYGEIITYKWRDPFIKCFLFETELNKRRKLKSVEDIPLSNELPPFLLRILKKINSSIQVVERIYTSDPNSLHQRLMKDIDSTHLTNILDTPLFKQYNIAAKCQ